VNAKQTNRSAAQSADPTDGLRCFPFNFLHRGRRVFRLLTFLSVLGASQAAPAADLPRAFIEKNCADCHDSETNKGDFRADLLGEDLSAAENRTGWSRVLARLQAGEMPPPSRTDRPSTPETKSALVLLKTALHSEARTRLQESGRVRIRRLNRLEYENTVRDLLGIDVALRDLLPEDDLRDGFTNQSGALSISPVHIQQYMAAADRALDAASVRQGRPETQTLRLAFNHEAEKP